MNQNNRFYGNFSGNEVDIDRVQENKDVDLYQRTKNEEVLEKVFKNRIPTLKYWAVQHYFPGLAPSIEDFYGELIIVFVKAVDGYTLGRGSFNTCLYTFLLNRIKNIKAGKYAKKRKPEFYEGPLSGIMLSLDFSYDGNMKSSKDGRAMTLGEKLENEDSLDYERNNKEVDFEESVDILTNGNLKLKEIFIKLGNGNSVSSLMRECKTKEGELEVDKEFIEEINKSKCKKTICDKIKEKHNLDSFKLLGYQIDCTILKYQVELKKTKESDMFAKTMRHLKKNKEKYINFLRGNDKNELSVL